MDKPPKNALAAVTPLAIQDLFNLFQPPYDGQAAAYFVAFFDADLTISRDVELRAGAEFDHAVEFAFFQAVSQIFPGNDASCQYPRDEDDQDGSVLARDPDGTAFIFKAHPFLIRRQEFALCIGLVGNLPFHRAAVAVHVEDGKENGDFMTGLSQKHVFLRVMAHVHDGAVRRRDEDIITRSDFIISGRTAEEIGEVYCKYKGHDGSIVPFHPESDHTKKECHDDKRVSFR